MAEIKVGQKYSRVGMEWGRAEGATVTVTYVSGEDIGVVPGTWDLRDLFFPTEEGFISSDKTMGYVLAEDVEQENNQLSPNEDMVNHPPHYSSDPSGVECIQITRHRNFNIGNAIKYLWRAGLKQSADKSAQEKQIEDLKKAVFYIQDEIKRLES